MHRIEIVCMANSRKLNGRCIAGLRADGKGWIRPVSHLIEGTLFESDYRLEINREPAILDVITIHLIEPKPKDYQPENWLISPTPWELINPHDLDIKSLLKGNLLKSEILFGNSLDRISQGTSVESSLAIIIPQVEAWIITKSFSGSRQTRVEFILGNFTYNLVVTDMIWHQKLGNLEEGRYTMTEIGIPEDAKFLLTISLGEVFNQWHYKLVACVLRLSESTASYLLS
jgi:hypothetical protein